MWWILGVGAAGVLSSVILTLKLRAANADKKLAQALLRGVMDELSRTSKERDGIRDQFRLFAKKSDAEIRKLEKVIEAGKVSLEEARHALGEALAKCTPEVAADLVGSLLDRVFEELSATRPAPTPSLTVVRNPAAPKDPGSKKSN